MQIFRQLFDAESSTYTYLLGDTSSGRAILIDPVKEQLGRDLALLGDLGLHLVYALDTHIHADHVTAAGLLREQTGCKTGTSATSGATCSDLALNDGDVVEIGAVRLEVLMTPGHTGGCLSFYDRSGGRVFTGDALLIRGCGRTDFQQGSAERLYDSVLAKLFTLPDETFVYPAHDYKGFTSSTIGEERRLNPRLTKSRPEFVQLMGALGLPMPKKIREAVPANLACGKS